MTETQIALRELEVREKQAAASVLMSAAMQSLGDVIRELKSTNSAEHAAVLDGVRDSRATVAELVHRMDSQTKMVGSVLGFFSSKKVATGIAIGVALSSFILGPIALTALPEYMAGVFSP